MTVGPGITPGLLTLPPTCVSSSRRQALAGYARCVQLPPVGNYTPPWERCRQNPGGGEFLTWFFKNCTIALSITYIGLFGWYSIEADGGLIFRGFTRSNQP